MREGGESLTNQESGGKAVQGDEESPREIQTLPIQHLNVNLVPKSDTMFTSYSDQAQAHNFKPLSLEQILKDVDFEKIGRPIDKKKRVYDLNLDSVEFSTPPPGSEEQKDGRMQQDELSSIQSAPVTSAFEKRGSPEPQLVRKDIPKLKNPDLTRFTKHKLPNSPGIRRSNPGDTINKGRVPFGQMAQTIDKTIKSALKGQQLAEKNKTVKKRQSLVISKTVKRWYNLQMTGDQLNEYICKQQMKFRKYSANIFTLQRAALKIQHWFFKKRLHQKYIAFVPYVQLVVPTKVVAKIAPKPTKDLKTKFQKYDQKVIKMNFDVRTGKSHAQYSKPPNTTRSTPQPEAKVTFLKTDKDNLNVNDLRSALKFILQDGQVLNLQKQRPAFDLSLRQKSASRPDLNRKSYNEVAIIKALNELTSQAQSIQRHSFTPKKDLISFKSARVNNPGWNSQTNLNEVQGSKPKYVPPPPVPHNESLTYIAKQYIRENLLERDLTKYNSASLKAEIPWNMNRYQTSRTILRKGAPHRHFQLAQTKATEHVIAKALGESFNVTSDRQGCILLEPKGIASRQLSIKSRMFQEKIDEQRAVSLLSRSLNSDLRTPYYQDPLALMVAQQLRQNQTRHADFKAAFKNSKFFPQQLSQTTPASDLKSKISKGLLNELAKTMKEQASASFKSLKSDRARDSATNSIADKSKDYPVIQYKAQTQIQKKTSTKEVIAQSASLFNNTQNSKLGDNRSLSEFNSSVKLYLNLCWWFHQKPFELTTMPVCNYLSQYNQLQQLEYFQRAHNVLSMLLKTKLKDFRCTTTNTQQIKICSKIGGHLWFNDRTTNNIIVCFQRFTWFWILQYMKLHDFLQNEKSLQRLRSEVISPVETKRQDHFDLSPKEGLLQQLTAFQKEVQAQRIQLSNAQEDQENADKKIVTIMERQEECFRAINSLSKTALNEIISYRHPTAIYIACFKILLVLFKIQPEGNNKQYSESQIVFYTAKKQFGNANTLLQMLLSFEINTLSGEQIDKIERIIKENQYSVENVTRTSQALAIVATWQLSILESNKIQAELKPLLDNQTIRVVNLQTLPSLIEENMNKMSALAKAIEEFEETPIEFDIKDESFQSNSANGSALRRLRSQRQKKDEDGDEVVTRLTQRLEVPIVKRLTLLEKQMPSQPKKWVH